ncbi:tape measure protein [Citrobacter portucalensis]|uniref:tape measure protein n=1 Tax=Citrobacter portucalensis TaxID=1639133 RepID=UPI00226B83A9|nr:tape measure protein [Citrobacter portucalensis]MCX9042512.1 tape measure protein [Citrobacter portucalensis]
MSDKVGSYYVDIDADVRKLLSGAHEADEALKIIENSVKKTEKSANKLDSSLNQLGGGFSRLAVAVKGYISIQALMKLQQLSEEFTLLQARVTRLSSSAEVGAKSFQQLVNIASVSGASLGDTVNLWQQLTATLKTVGATNSDVNRLVLTLQKIGTIGGSSSQEMANALRQFMQSVAAGRIQAEEFNSVLEQMPELARQIAAGMGVPYDQLRQLMLAGKLDIGEVLAAIEKQSAEVNHQFETMPRTVTQATNALITQFGVAISKIDNAIGASRYLAKLLDGAALNVSLVAGNAPDAVLLTQKLAQNTEQLAVAESDLALARKAGVSWGIKQTQQTVDRLKAERAMILMAQQASKDAQSVYTPSKGEKPAYITNLEKKTAENNANAIIQSGQTLVDKLTKQREKLSQYKAQGLLDDKKYADATAVLDQQIAEARKKQDKAPKNAFARGDDTIDSLQRQIAVLTMRYSENTREAAQYNAVAALGAKATDAQKAKVSELAGTLFDAQQRQKDLNDAISNDPVRKENKSYTDASEQLRRQLDGQMIDQKTYNKQSEQLEQQHQANLARIRVQESTANPVAEARAEVDPIQQLANQNAQKLALMQQYQQQEQAILKQGYLQGILTHDQFIAAKTTTDEQYLALRTAQENQFNEQMTAAQWQLLSQQGLGYDMLTSAVDAFAGNASNAITGLITGSMTAQDAMRSLGSTMLNSVVNSLVQVGVEALKNFIIGQTLGAAATAAGASQAAILASAWAPAAALASLASFGANSVPAMAGIASTVGLSKTLAVAGARKNGGPVNADSMYRVGEGGKPEIYRASTGKQYMIPGDNGKVISNKDMQGSGQAFTVIVENHGTPLNVYDQQVEKGLTGQDVIRIVVGDIQEGGLTRQAITAYTTARSKATG